MLMKENTTLSIFTSFKINLAPNKSVKINGNTRFISKDDSFILEYIREKNIKLWVESALCAFLLTSVSYAPPMDSLYNIIFD